MRPAYDDAPGTNASASAPKTAGNTVARGAADAAAHVAADVAAGAASATATTLAARIDRAFTVFETWLPVALLAAAGVLGLATVVLRYGFGLGFAWAQGVLVLLAVLSAFVACSGAVRTDEHLRFDLLIGKLPPRSQALAKALVDLIALAFLVLLLVLVVRFLRFELRFGGTSMDTYLPEWVPPAGVGLAVAMMSLRYLQRLVAAVRTALDPPSEEGPR